MTSMLVLSVPSFAVYFCDLSLPATYTGNPLQMMSSDGIPLLPSQAVTLCQVLSQSFDKTCYANNTIIKSE